MTTIEKMARAIAKRTQGEGCEPSEWAFSIARAALEALRAEWTKRWGELHPGVVAIDAALSEK